MTITLNVRTMKRNKLQMPLYAAMSAIMALGMIACEEPAKTGTNTQEETLQKIIADYVDKTIVPTYSGMADASMELYDACVEMKKAGTGNVTEDMVKKADAAWIKARRYWELSEAWLFGAAADYNIDPHIDSWPLDKTAMENLLANQKQMSQMDEDGYYVGNMLGYGLLGFHAVEYMIFELNTNGTESLPRNTSKYTAEELRYLAAVAGDLRNQCIRLEASWAGMENISKEKQDILAEGELEPTRNYGKNMKNAGKAGSTYVNYLEAVQEMIVGAQDIADEVGGLKIGNPTGMGEEDDPDYIESPYSLNSITDFTDNLISIQNAYQGYQGTDDPYLKPVAHSLSAYIYTLNADLDSKVKTAIQDAIDKIGQMKEPFAKTARDPNYKDINKAAIDACTHVTKVLNEVLNILSENH